MKMELSVRDRIIIACLVLIARYMGRFTLASEETFKMSLDEIVALTKLPKET